MVPQARAEWGSSDLRRWVFGLRPKERMKVIDCASLMQRQEEWRENSARDVDLILGTTDGSKFKVSDELP